MSKKDKSSKPRDNEEEKDELLENIKKYRSKKKKLSGTWIGDPDDEINA